MNPVCWSAPSRNAAQANGCFYPLVWLREMGRVHSSSVQGELVNPMSKYDILLPDGRRLDGSKVDWVADSNYQADGDFDPHPGYPGRCLEAPFHHQS